jgi:hypothetical protein
VTTTGGLEMKTFYVQDNIGSKNKYIVRFHDGVKAHADGSPFFDIRFFKNKPSLKEFTDKLKREGYKHDQHNVTGVAI